MSTNETDLLTPIYIREPGDESWPEDPTFYLVSRDGLFLGRNHGMFRSCTPVEHGPTELAPQHAFLEPRYPMVPQVLMERLVGFFTAMASEHQCEVGAYLIYDRETEVVSAVIPNQVSTVNEGWNGTVWPVGLKYENIESLPPEQMILGTIHSHVYGPAYSSGVDVHDEVDKPGVHLVVGKLDLDPPDFHADAVVDGTRFRLDLRCAIEGYEKPLYDYPAEWKDRVTVKVSQPWGAKPYPNSGGSASGGYGSGSYGTGRYGSGSYSSGSYGDADSDRQGGDHR